MRIQARKDFTVAVLDLEGRLTAGQGVACLNDGVDGLLARGLANIVLNMDLVDIVDCAGIGQLVHSYCKACRQGGSLKLVHVHRRLRDLLELFHLQTYLEVFDSEQSAIPSLATLILKSSPGKSVLARLDGNDLASAQTRPNPAQSSQPEAGCWPGEVGGTISHYRITEKIGEGGMGAVYKAEDTRLDRTVALKFLNQSAITSDEQKERLVLEAKAAAALNHPNVCTVHEICEAAGQMCIVMEYIEGESLRQKIKRSPLNLDEALDLAIGIGEGLKAVHRKRIIHRDVKSANIMVMPEGRPKIMDFGLAFLGDRSPAAMTGTSYGTPAYMSPEQVRGETVTARADIWALGVIVYEMISGVLPFYGQSAQALLNSILSDEPTPLSEWRCGLPLELERIVDKALAKKPADRYQHMGEMVRDLEGLRKNAHVGVRPRRSEPREFGAVRWTAM